MQPKPDQDVIDLDKLKHSGSNGASGQHKDALSPLGMRVLVVDDGNRRGQEETLPFEPLETVGNDGSTKDAPTDAGNTGDRLHSPQQKVR